MQHMFGQILLKINISSINRFLCIFSKSFEHEEIYKWIVSSSWLCKKANKNSIKFGYLLKIENEILGILFYFLLFLYQWQLQFFPCQRMWKILKNASWASFSTFLTCWLAFGSVVISQMQRPSNRDELVEVPLLINISIFIA